jgi:hypothetical protein
MRFRLDLHVLEDAFESLTNLLTTSESLKLVSHKSAIVSEDGRSLVSVRVVDSVEVG